jgi:hypothetical protein
MRPRGLQDKVLRIRCIRTQQGQADLGWQRSSAKSYSYQAFDESCETYYETFCKHFDYDVTCILQGHNQPEQLLIDVGGTDKSILISIDAHKPP